MYNSETGKDLDQITIVGMLLFRLRDALDNFAKNSEAGNLAFARHHGCKANLRYSCRITEGSFKLQTCCLMSSPTLSSGQPGPPIIVPLQ